MGLVEGTLTRLCAKHLNPELGASFKEPTSQVKRISLVIIQPGLAAGSFTSRCK